MRAKVSKVIILVLTAFIGLGTYVGGICMLIGPNGSIVKVESKTTMLGQTFEGKEK